MSLGLRPDGVIGMRLRFGSGSDARAQAASLQRLREGARVLSGVRVARVSAGFPLENAAATAAATEKSGLVAPVDPAAPVLRVAMLRDHLDGLHHHLRVAPWLPEWCGLASLALAAMGAHGLLAYRVARQRKEIGLRRALGADRHAVIQLVVARTLQAVLIGLAAGGVGSFV